MSLGQATGCLLAGSPFWAFLLWAAWWLVSDARRELRRTRAAARLAKQYLNRRDDR
jgi:hypothetical protein